MKCKLYHKDHISFKITNNGLECFSIADHLPNIFHVLPSVL